MRILLAADWHLGHDKLIEKAGRPPDFNERILDNLKKVRATADVLIFLGDICIRNDDQHHYRIREALGGLNQLKRWLILGNHDRKTKTWYLQHGWDFVAKELTFDAFGLRLLFTHIPQPPGDYDINIHGHLHNTGHHPECGLHGRQRLVMSEHTYAPINLATLLKGVKKGR